LRYLPADIVHRRKSGFGVPLQPWFATQGPMGQLLDAAIQSDTVTSLLDKETLNRLVAEHRNARADHSELLWSVLNLQLWRDAFGM